jgi:DNA-binding MurR/RpiR family transcriptional regulator
VKAKLQFLSGRGELVRNGCGYENLKQALVDRLSDNLPDQYYYTRLQDAAQGRDQSAEEFGDRCRKLYQRTIRKVQDEEVQRTVNEEAERRLLATYIHGLRGVVGQQVQIQIPNTMAQAVKLSVTVGECRETQTDGWGFEEVVCEQEESRVL